MEKLRSGPIADLYRALQQPLGRSVLDQGADPSILPSSPFAATLEREARLLAELHHPNILQIHDFVRRDDRMWLVLEYVDGWTLDELLRQAKRLPPAAAAAIALELARARPRPRQEHRASRRATAQRAGRPRQGQVKLTGFSVAVEERLPTAPELLDGGTGFAGPAYMSPEQLLGEPPDPRSDLFSLGVSLYEMFSGEPPFRAPDERGVTQLIRHKQAPPLGRSVAVPGSLERMVRRCLKNARRSLSERGQLANTLEQLVGGGSAQRMIGNSLATVGLLDEAPKSLGEIPPPVAFVPRRASLATPLGGLAVCFGLARSWWVALPSSIWPGAPAADHRRVAPRVAWSFRLRGRDF